MTLARVAITSGRLSLLALAAMGSGLSCTLMSSNAMADDTGWYVGGNVGQSRAKIDDERITSSLLSGGLTTTNITDRKRDTGYKLFGGYQLNKNFALEGGYFDLGKFGYTAYTLPTGTLDGNIKVRGANLDLIGSLPVTEKFSVFGRGGVTYAQARDTFAGTGAVGVTNPHPSKSAAGYSFGAGLQYAMTPALALRTEVARYRINDAVGNKGDIDLVSVGLVYRFGSPVQTTVARAATPQPQPRPEVVAPVTPVAAVLPAPRFEKYTLSATELFTFNSAQLQMPQPKLDEIANVLKKDATVNHVVISGHADRIGSASYNQTLSEHRAVAVKNYLVSQGIEDNRLSAEGRGESNPVVVCTDKKRADLIACLAPNRRVEVENITLERRVP